MHGGAIALGHPFGMTGARIMTTLINGLQTEDKTIGLESHVRRRWPGHGHDRRAAELASEPTVEGSTCSCARFSHPRRRLVRGNAAPGGAK